MFQIKFLFVALQIFKIVASLPVEEKIEPVNLAYSCLRVDSDESKTNSPILLLHGLAGSSKVWDSLKLLLASRTKRRVCAVDLRNHGDSPWNNRTDIEALAVDIHYFLDNQGIKKINIIGQSLGGKVAIHYALKNPDRVDSIIVEDIRPNGVTQEAYIQISTLFQILKAALESVPAETSNAEARKYIVDFINKKLEEMGSTERIPNQFAEYIELRRVERKWQFKFNMALIEEALKNPGKFMTESTGLYEGPALFIYGTKSPFKVYEDKESILKLFPKAELFPVESAGHIIHGLFPEFEDAVVRFLNKLK